MKMKVLAAAALLLGSSSFAMAADPALPIEEIPAGFTWTGAYVGAHLGYGWGDSDFTDLEGYNLFEQTFAVDPDGAFGGVQAGYNWQTGSLVVGVEAELGYLNLEDTALQEDGSFNDTYGSVDGGLYGGLSARLGYALDRTLLYAKAGAVYFDGDVSVSDSCTDVSCGDATLEGSESVGWGYQVGAGVEHAVTDNWTVKLEYAYFDFGSETIAATMGGAASGLTDYEADLSAHTIKIGANYKF